MNTKINLKYNDITYTLEYNRMSIKMIENEGFELEEFGKKPMSMIELVFKGAFYKNHRSISQNTLNEIYKNCEDKDNLLNVITQMITECYTSLMDSPEKGKEGNATWEVVSLSPQVETLE
jgi:hypothetical protein